MVVNMQTIADCALVADRMSPLFRRADEQLIRIIAIMSNQAAGTTFDEAGYSVVYTSTTETPDEEKARREQLQFERAEGLVSQIDMWMEYHPGATRTDAVRALTPKEGCPQRSMPRVSGGGTTRGRDTAYAHATHTDVVLTAHGVWPLPSPHTPPLAQKVGS